MWYLNPVTSGYTITDALLLADSQFGIQDDQNNPTKYTIEVYPTATVGSLVIYDIYDTIISHMRIKSAHYNDGIFYVKSINEDEEGNISYPLYIFSVGVMPDVNYVIIHPNEDIT